MPVHPVHLILNSPMSLWSILEGEEGDSFEARLDILSSVPIEVAHLILGYLGVGDVVRCSHVSSAWYSLTNYNPLWKRLCYQWTWNNTRMVDDYRTHRFQMPKIKLADLEPTCRWKTNFERNYRLPKRWARGECVSYDLRVGSVSSQVTCFHSDGDTLAVGHADSTVSTFDVERLPRHLSTAGALLADKPVTAVRTDSNNIVVVQGGLVQIMRRPRGDTFEIVSCKSLEVCSSLVEVWERLGATVGDFEESYLSLLSAPGAVTPTQQQILVELKTEIYCAVRGRHLVYSWCPQTGQRTLCLQLPGHPHSSLKDVTVHRTDKGDRLIHTLFSSRSNSVRLACYSVASGSWMFEVGCGCCRVESLLSGTSLLVGMVRSGSILCWQLNTGRAIPSTVTSRSA
ncbi:hypothetical protein AAG570_009722 [Ranatra chinensis]|uniref:F-box domain-containing protein n=1 Tax=Ranatra chinensis TaxID=642074 RepID=A0ABD0Z0Q4_9HEMI